MNDVKVSVIIPVYNAENYLKQCLDSVLGQSLREIEIICVDDGSLDNSVKILEDYSQKDSRILLLRQKNSYAGTARNLGMQHATGKYLSFLDADDFFSPYLLEKMYITAEQQGSDIVICNTDYFDSIVGQNVARKTWAKEEFMPKNKMQFSRENVSNQLFQLTNGWAWDKLFLTSFIRYHDIKFSGSRIANDGYFVYMAMALAKCITKIDDYLVTQRINNKNSLANTREDSWYCGIQMLYDIKKGLEDVGLYKKLEKTFLNFALDYLMWSFNDMKSYVVKEKIYDCIQGEFKKSFRIRDFLIDYFYHSDLYEEYSYIENHSFKEYLIQSCEQKTFELSMLQEHYKNYRAQMNKKIWLFPYPDIEKGAAIVLYGAGKMGQDYFHQILETDYCKIVLWMDKKFESEKGPKEICGWKDDLENINFDKIVLAIYQKEKANEVMSMLQEWGIAKEKIIWKENG